MLSLGEFKERVTVITGAEADRIRDRYIERFVDTASEWYRAHIATRKRYRDGVYYSGYLWETLKNYRVIQEADILGDRDLLDGQIYAMWDLHSQEKILIGDYWKFPRGAVLQLAYDDLIAGLDHLPEDLYIFDREYSRSLILTHEHSETNSRICVEAT